jgi:hypothetical protein
MVADSSLVSAWNPVKEQAALSMSCWAASFLCGKADSMFVTECRCLALGLGAVRGCGSAVEWEIRHGAK